MNISAIAKDLVPLLGGKENIVSAAHCATRLRLVLADDSKVNKAAIDKLAPAGRPQSFFARTSCSIALSRDRSATKRLSLAFSSSSCRSRFTSDGIRPA